MTRETMRLHGDIMEWDKTPEEAEAIKRFRLEAGMSHKAMADFMGISKMTLINWEKPTGGVRINTEKAPRATAFWGTLHQYMDTGEWPEPFTIYQPEATE